MRRDNEALVFCRLDEYGAEAVYNEYMKKDFPSNELKPFFAIKKAMEEGTYTAFGAYRGGELYGYAYFATAEKDGETIALLDYFAVVPEKRGQGIGTEMLKALSPERLCCSCILIESESTDGTTDPREKEVRQRRIRFYENCGAVNTGVAARLYGVDYDILAVCRRGNSLGEEEAYRLIGYMYNEMYGNLPWYPEKAGVWLKKNR